MMEILMCQRTEGQVKLYTSTCQIAARTRKSVGRSGGATTADRPAWTRGVLLDGARLHGAAPIYPFERLARALGGDQRSDCSAAPALGRSGAMYG